MTYDAFDVVAVPFPFTDRVASKRRPALVLSRSAAFGSPAGHSVLAMITSAGRPGWPLDVAIGNPGVAGLTAESVVRMKLFTLDHSLVLRRLGRLGRADQAKVREALRRLLPV